MSLRRHFHAVRFFDSAESPGSIVAAFLGAGFVAREPAVVVATPAHRSAITTALQDLNFDIASLQASGSLRMIDAAGCVNTVMVNGTPDPVRFEAFGNAVFAQLSRVRLGGIRVYSETVDLLGERNLAAAAVQLETLWDRFTVTHACSLLCGFTAEGRRGDRGRRAVCEQHSHVVAGNGLPHPLVG
jgi:hypothetical protein